MIILPLLVACTSPDYQVVGGSTPKFPSHQIQAQETATGISTDTIWSQLGFLVLISGSQSGFYTLGIAGFGEIIQSTYSTEHCEVLPGER